MRRLSAAAIRWPAVARLAPLACAWALLVSAPAGFAQNASKEYQVKAVFLLNFLQFVQWPAEAFPEETSPIRIAVLGEDPFGTILDEAVRGEKVGKRPVTVERARRWQDVRECHLVFVSESERVRVGEILAALPTAPVLLVSEIPDFGRRGGVIRFFLEGSKVRFEINLASAQRRGLKLSSQLLSVARIAPDPSRGP